MKRTYLTVPGESVTIAVTGISGVGKTQIINKLTGIFGSEGLLIQEHPPQRAAAAGCGFIESFTIECPSTKVAQARYLETLGEHEVSTLRAHLDALGYELS